MIDAFAAEPQFLDHLAPVWAALPSSLRGTFWVDNSLEQRAALKGVLRYEGLNAAATRTLPLPRTGSPHGKKALVASIGDTKIARRLGYGDFARMEHGAGQTYVGNLTGSYPGGPDNGDASLVLVPNEYAAGHWRNGYPDAKVVIVGCPRLADLPHRQYATSEAPVIAVTWHWPAMIQEASNAWADFGPALHELKRKYEVIGSAHPKGDWPQRMAKRYARMGIEFVPEFEDVCRRADLLIFDNTSVGFEFAATGRPVVVMNPVQYRRNVHHGLRFWECASVGVQADATPDTRKNTGILLDAVALALQDTPEQRRARGMALGQVYPVSPIYGLARAAQSIVEWAAQ